MGVGPGITFRQGPAACRARRRARNGQKGPRGRGQSSLVVVNMAGHFRRSSPRRSGAAGPRYAKPSGECPRGTMAGAGPSGTFRTLPVAKNSPEKRTGGSGRPWGDDERSVDGTMAKRIDAEWWSGWHCVDWGDPLKGALGAGGPPSFGRRNSNRIDEKNRQALRGRQQGPGHGKPPDSRESGRPGSRAVGGGKEKTRRFDGTIDRRGALPGIGLFLRCGRPANPVREPVGWAVFWRVGTYAL